MAEPPTGSHHGTVKLLYEAASVSHRPGIVFDLLVEVLDCSGVVGAVWNLHSDRAQLSREWQHIYVATHKVIEELTGSGGTTVHRQSMGDEAFRLQNTYHEAVHCATPQGRIFACIHTMNHKPYACMRM